MTESTMGAFEKVDDELDNLYERNRKVEVDPPEYLYHNTNVQGLIGILTERKLRTSGADFLNDLSEPEYAFGILKEILEEIESGGSHGEIVAQGLRGCWQWIMEKYKKEGPHLYVFCFSKDDLLSQWRSYGGHGAGYALGFSSSRLCKSLQSHLGQFLVKIVYDQTEQMQEAERVFKEIISVVNEVDTLNNGVPADNSVVNKIVGKFRNAIFSEVVRLRAKFKIWGFHEEGEWRLVQFVPSDGNRPQVKFQAGSGTIKPYLEVDIGELPIERVTIGPTLNPKLSHQALNLLLDKQRYLNVRVTESTVPYRQ